MAIKTTISIGQLSERTGISVSAIRYYEEQGLILPERSVGGQRRFLRSDIRRLSFVLIAQQVGFTLDQIRVQLASLPEGRTPTKADWKRMGKTFTVLLDEKIETLSLMRRKLDGCIGCGCLSLETCKLYNPQDIAHKKGTGPRFLLGDVPIE